jgi:hypothetical protein
MVKVLRTIDWDHERCWADARGSKAWAPPPAGCRIVWDVRSLTSFGDQPIEELTRHSDLLVIGHSFVDLATLRTLGWKWVGLATDVACQVSVVCVDLLDRPLSLA